MKSKLQPHRTDVITKRTPLENSIWEEERLRKRDGQFIEKRFYVEVSMRNLPGKKPVRPMLHGSAPTLVKARILRDTLRHRLRQDIEGKAMTVAEYFQNEYLAELNSRRSEQSAYNLRCCFERHILPAIGGIRLSEVTAHDLEKIIFEVLKERSNGTKANYRKFLKWFFQSAQKLDLVNRNPADLVKKLDAVKPKPKEYLTYEQSRQLLSFMRDQKHPYFPHVALAVLTGMRVNEQRGLLWKNVHFDKGLILVSRTFDGKHWHDHPKDKEDRWVPLALKLKPILEDLKKQADPSPDDFVLPQLRKWRSKEQGQILSDLCYIMKFPQMRWYDLRASYVMALCEKGVDIYKISEILGHSDISVTSNYIRKLGIRLKGVADGLDFLD